MVDSFEYAIYFMGILGIAWPGKFLIGLITILEFLPSKVRLRYCVYVCFSQAIFLCFLPTYYQRITKDSEPILCISLIISLISFLFVVLFVPETPFYSYQSGNYQNSRQTIEGVLKMNGQDAKLIFRFDSESLSEHNRALYGQGDHSNAGNDEERSTINLSTNPTRMSHYLPEGVIIVGISANNDDGKDQDQASEELSHKRFLLNLFRFSNLLTCLTLKSFILVAVFKLPKQLSMLDTTRFYASADLCGVMLGSVMLSIVGFNKTLAMLLTTSLICVTLMMYVEERHLEYGQITSFRQRQWLMTERRQYLDFITALIFSLKVLLQASTTNVFICALSRSHKIFSGHLRVSAVSFVHIMSMGILPILFEVFGGQLEQQKVDSSSEVTLI